MKVTPRLDTVWDVVVVGGGPAGMMAAGRAAERGKSVLLLEKNPTLGKKLLITGGGRCNVTNNKTDVRTMLAQYKKNDKFLFSAFTQFGVLETFDFFNGRGMATKVEAEDRVFPLSNKAKSVWDVLVDYIKEGGVSIQVGNAVTGIHSESSTGNIKIERVRGETICAKSCIIATGGTSRPETGSSGEGFVWLKYRGHTIIENNAALVPIALHDHWAKQLGGVSLSDIRLTTYQNNKKQESRKGKLLFTHFGVSGPTILNMSKEVGALLENDEVTIMLDVFPSLDHTELKQKIQTLLIGESNKKIKNTISKLLPAALGGAVLDLCAIDLETPNHSVSTEQRKKLVTILKAIPLHVSGLLGADKAVVSSGGVALSEIDFKTMQSRIVPNLYIVGDVLNIDRPSGGYSLQLCWTTGYVAGNSC